MHQFQTILKIIEFNSIDDDPNAFQYISGENTLENSATSIKILLTAHINQFSDIRAFYAIGEEQGFTPIFEPFPGYTSNKMDHQIVLFLRRMHQKVSYPII